jgi:hypothetical protein
MAAPAMPCNWQEEKKGTYISLPKRRWVEARWDTRLEATANSGSPGAGFGVVGSDVVLGRGGTYARRRARPSPNGLPPATPAETFTPCNYPTRPGKRSSSRIAATTQFAFSKSLASLPPDYSGEDLLPNLSRGESVESQASWPKALVLNPINSLERSFCLGLRCLCGTMGKPRSRVILEKSLVSNVNVASREGFEDPAHQAETA